MLTRGAPGALGPQGRGDLARSRSERVVLAPITVAHPSSLKAKMRNLPSGQDDARIED